MEEWKTVKNFPRYEVSNLGRVKAKRSGRVKTQSISRQGYYFINMYKEDMTRPTAVPVHRIVAWEFVPGDTSLTVNHKNGVKTDNTPQNLEWVSRAENAAHAWATGLTPTLRGETCGKSVLSEDKIRDIRYRLAIGHTQTEVAKCFRITQANVSAIFKRKTWKHI